MVALPHERSYLRPPVKRTVSEPQHDVELKALWAYLTTVPAVEKGNH